MNQGELEFNDGDGEVPEDIPARNNDPETSKEAARRIARKYPKRFSAKSVYYRLLCHFRNGQFTDEEIAKLISPPTAEHCNIETPRKRCSELRQWKYIIETGERRCNPGSPDKARVCTIDDRGVAALRRVESTGWSL